MSRVKEKYVDKTTGGMAGMWHIKVMVPKKLGNTTTTGKQRIKERHVGGRELSNMVKPLDSEVHQGI